MGIFEETSNLDDYHEFLEDKRERSPVGRGVILLCNSVDKCSYYIRDDCRHSKPHAKIDNYEDKCDGTCHKSEACCIEAAR